ncbi:MAG TPA: OsmC family protein [Longimicrobium sp.]
MTSSQPAAPTVRTYEVRAETTDTFGRVRCHVRQHRLTVDGPVQNGCPGEAPTPGEMFLAGAAACGAEVLQVLARDGGVPLERVEVTVRGTIDREHQPHAEVTVFTQVELSLRLVGPDPEQAAALVAGFQRRCPVYGSLAVASGRVDVRHETVPHEPSRIPT